MKTEEQVKDIIRQLNGCLIEYKNIALDSLYRGENDKVIEYLDSINNVKYGIKLLEYVLSDECVYDGF